MDFLMDHTTEGLCFPFDTASAKLHGNNFVKIQSKVRQCRSEGPWFGPRGCFCLEHIGYVTKIKSSFEWNLALDLNRCLCHDPNCLKERQQQVTGGKNVFVVGAK